MTPACRSAERRCRAPIRAALTVPPSTRSLARAMGSAPAAMYPRDACTRALVETGPAAATGAAAAARAVGNVSVVAAREGDFAAGGVGRVLVGGLLERFKVGNAARRLRSALARRPTVRRFGANVRGRVGLTAFSGVRQATVQAGGSDAAAALGPGHGANRRADEALATGFGALAADAAVDG